MEGFSYTRSVYIISDRAEKIAAQVLAGLGQGGDGFSWAGDVHWAGTGDTPLRGDPRRGEPPGGVPLKLLPLKSHSRKCEKELKISIEGENDLNFMT